MVVVNHSNDMILRDKISNFKDYMKGNSQNKEIIYYGEAEANELIETPLPHESFRVALSIKKTLILLHEP